MSIVVSADEHLVEPHEFWSDWLPTSLPAADWDRAPTLVNGAFVVDGQTTQAFRLFPDLTAFSDTRPGVGDAEDRLHVIDAEGIEMSILFPQRAMGLFAAKDPALRTRCTIAYNEFLADFCATSGGRLTGVAILPTVYQPEASADYLAHLPDDIAQAVRYLAGPESSCVTGQSFAVDGGNGIRKNPDPSDLIALMIGQDRLDLLKRAKSPV